MRSSLRLAAATLLALWGVSGCGHAPIGGAARAAGTLGAHAARAPFELLVLPDQGVAPLLVAIAGARQSIALELYMFTDHDLTAQLVQALGERAKAGVKVRVMLEPHPYVGTTPGPSPNLDAAKALAALGVAVQDTAPGFTYTHEKAMVIDGSSAYVMTCNFTNAAFSSNREYVVVDQEPHDVAEVASVFEADWARTPYAPRPSNLVVSPVNSRARLLALIDSATKTLVVQDEELGDAAVYAHLGARIKAGVDVRVMVANIATLVPQERQALAAVGVTRFEPLSAHTLHAKAIVADGARVYVGSENLSTNSLDHNRELGVVLTDPGVVAGLVKTTEQDWAAK